MRPGDHLHLHLPDFDVGGTEQWALAMGDALSGSPYRLSITASSRLDGPARATFETWEPIAIEAIPGEAYVIAPCDIDQLVKQNRRVIAVAHGMNDYYKSLLAPGGYYRAVAVSKVARQAFPAGVEVTVIHNGVNLDRLHTTRTKEEIRRSLHLREDAVVIGHVGRMSIGKNPLLAAMAAGSMPDGVAVYVGPRPSPEMRHEASKHADCRFLTAGADWSIADCYAVMDVCLVGSRSEGFSLVIAEAWASLTPVISTPVGVALEHPAFVISIAPEVDKATLASAVRSALAPDRMSVMDEARTLVRERFSLAAMARRWREFLESVG